MQFNQIVTMRCDLSTQTKKSIKSQISNHLNCSQPMSVCLRPAGRLSQNLERQTQNIGPKVAADLPDDTRQLNSRDTGE